MKPLKIFIVTVILVVIAGPSLIRRNRGPVCAQQAGAVTQISSFKTALDLFKEDCGDFPTGLMELVTNTRNTPNWQGPYIEQIPLDPWNHAYLYQYPGKRNLESFDLVSCGPDGKPGTEDDILSWNPSRVMK